MNNSTESIVQAYAIFVLFIWHCKAVPFLLAAKNSQSTTFCGQKQLFWFSNRLCLFRSLRFNVLFGIPFKISYKTYNVQQIACLFFYQNFQRKLIFIVSSHKTYCTVKPRFFLFLSWYFFQGCAYRELVLRGKWIVEVPARIYFGCGGGIQVEGEGNA